nr:MAG TPA: hypothetical protein [Caudoviricetes sp.]
MKAKIRCTNLLKYGHPSSFPKRRCVKTWY